MPTITIQSEKGYPKFLIAWGGRLWEISADPNDGIPEGCIDQIEWILKERRKRKGKNHEPEMSAA